MSIFRSIRGGLPSALMGSTDLFPEVGAPRYQRAAEMISFVLVATMLIGSLISSVFLLVYEL